MSDCIFCKIISGELPAAIITQTDKLIVIKDKSPKAPIHYLIIPKKHIEDLRTIEPDDKELACQLVTMPQQLSKTLKNCPFQILIRNGYDAGQRVFHLHAHFLAGTTFSE